MSTNNAIFVTGATGFLGGVLVCNFLIRKEVDIYCLVRTRPDRDVTQRLHEAVLAAAAMASIPQQRVLPILSRVKAIQGDIKTPGLGVSAVDIERLRQANVQAVWHSAAYLRFEEEYRKKVFEQNVTGTRCVLDFARALGIPELNYISTAYVAGDRAGHIPEESCRSSLAWPATNPYEESKRITEEMLERECTAFDIYLRILRPSIIIGSSTTYISTSDFSFYGFLYGLDRFVDWVKNRLDGFYNHYPLTIRVEPGNVHDFIPVDVVAEEAVEISEVRSGSPEYHHLTNPYPVDIDTLVKGSKRAFPGINFVTTHERSDLKTLDHLFAKKLYFYQPYFFNSKLYARRKPLHPKYKSIKFSAHEIYKYGDHFLNDSRKKMFREDRLVEESLNEFVRHRGISFDGVGYDYLSRGEGDLVILLCPVGVGIGLWEQVANRLREHCTVVVLDNPALYAESTDRGNELAAYLDNIAEVFKLESKANARIVAWDSSLPMACRIAREFPDKITGIVAINPFLPMLAKPKALQTSAERLLFAMIEEYRAFDGDYGPFYELVAEYIADNFATRKIEEPLPALASFVKLIPRKYRSLFIAPLLNETTLENFRATMQPPDSPGIDALALPDSVPVKVLRARGDDSVDARLLAEWAGACRAWEEHFLATESHWLPLDAPDQVVSEILAGFVGAARAAS